MARRIRYKFNKVAKEINFANDQYHDIYEAVAAAEGVDLTQFLLMEQQIAMTSKGSSALKNFRLQEFARFGFSEISLIKDID